MLKINAEILDTLLKWQSEKPEKRSVKVDIRWDELSGEVEHFIWVVDKDVEWADMLRKIEDLDLEVSKKRHEEMVEKLNKIDKK